MLYERIWKLRKEKHLTQVDLANYLEVSQRTYSRYENGERHIPTEALIGLANFHNTSIDYILGRTDDPKLHTIPKDADK